MHIIVYVCVVYQRLYHPLNDGVGLCLCAFRLHVHINVYVCVVYQGLYHPLDDGAESGRLRRMVVLVFIVFLVCVALLCCRLLLAHFTE